MPLDAVAATLRAYLEASGAVAATAVVPEGTVTVLSDGTVDVEPAVALGPAEPEPLDVEVRRLPPFDVDGARGEVSGPLGAVEHVAECVQALARAVGGGRCVAFVQYPTRDEETPFGVSAREGEGLVVVVGEEQYEMEAGWPGV